MLCVECGREREIFREGVCLECYLKHHIFSHGPAFIDIPICVHCGSLKYKNIWMKDSFETVLKRWVKHLFSIERDLKNIDIELSCRDDLEEIPCEITIIGFIDDVEIREKHHITVRLKGTVCDICSKRFGGYHEAIIQLRASQRIISDQERKNLKLFIENMVSDMQEKGNRKLFITDIGEERGGIDFYLSDKQAAHAIIKRVQERFGGELKTSSKNIGMKDGKKVYRMTYLLRLHHFQKGDFLSYQNKYFYISTVSKNKVHAYELSKWEQHVFDGRELSNAIVLGGNELIREMIVVSQREDELQVMDPKNYKLFEIKKPIKTSVKNKMIPIVLLKDKMYILLTDEKETQKI